MRVRIGFLTTLLLCSFSSLNAQEPGAQFLAIPVGARASALGQAMTTLSYDTDALNWNPAALTRPWGGSRGIALSLNHQALYSDSQLTQFGAVVPVGAWAFGANMVQLSYPSIDVRRADGSTAGKTDASDMALGFGMATTVSRDIHLGLQLRYISQKLGSEQAEGQTLDLGLISPTPVKKLMVGASARNLGTQMKFLNEKFELPAVYSLGTSYQIHPKAVLGLDLQSKAVQHQNVLAVASEINPVSLLFLRVGYAKSLSNHESSEFDGQDKSSLMTGFSGGIGLQLQGMTMDYAVSPFGELGETQSVSFSFRFGSFSPPTEVVRNAPSRDDSERTLIQFNTGPDPMTPPKPSNPE